MSNQPPKDNAIAYCHNKKHMGYLTATMLKQHECLKKECPFLEKYDNHQFWIRRQIKTLLKKYHKNENLGCICINDIPYKTDNEDKIFSWSNRFAFNKYAAVYLIGALAEYKGNGRKEGCTQ